jgi:hypothetical protein
VALFPFLDGHQVVDFHFGPEVGKVLQRGFLNPHLLQVVPDVGLDIVIQRRRSWRFDLEDRQQVNPN